MSYSTIKKLPSISINDIPEIIPDLGLNQRRESNQEWDNIPRLKFDSLSVIDFLKETGIDLNVKDLDLSEIFSKLETYSGRHMVLCRQVSRLAVRLLIYSQLKPKNGFAIKPSDYLKWNLKMGPGFTEWLSKARAAAMIKSLSYNLSAENENYISEKLADRFGILQKMEKYDYDSFLNERFLIDFEETADDFEWAFKPVETVPETLEVFRKYARKMLVQHKTTVTEATDADKAHWISDSVTIENNGPKLNRVLLREMAEKKETRDYFSRQKPSHMNFKRSIVQVDPGNVRDTWQCDIRTLCVVKRVSHILRQVLENLPNSAMASSLTVMKRRKFLKKEKFFMMFDIKKCGLSINRELLIILGEELESIYPGKGFDELFNWRTVNVHWKDNIYSPKRGTGMGNCNEGVTLIQCVVGFMAKELLGIRSIFFNDDGVFCSSKGSFRAHALWVYQTFKNLGIILNREKSINSESNVFCEEYVTVEGVDYTKKQLLIVNFADVFFKKNITSAKMLFNSLDRSQVGRGFSINILPSIIAYWGNEFHRMERLMPFEFGGWRYFGRTNFNECLRFAFDPRLYIEDDQDRGFIGHMRAWMGFLILHQKMNKMGSLRNKIPFRKFIPNPFKDWEIMLGDGDMSVSLLSQLGISTDAQLRESLNDLYNFRGSKNAKPQLHDAYVHRFRVSRKILWKDFIARCNFIYALTPTPGHVRMALEYLKGEDQSPLGYVPPDFMITRAAGAPEGTLRPLGKLVKNRLIPIPSPSSRYGLARLLESLNFQRIEKGAEIFSLIDMMQRSKSQYILADVRLHTSREELELPDWLYLFLPNKEFAIMIYLLITKNKMVPIEWMNYPVEKKVFDMALNPIKYIFPGSFGRFKEIIDRKPLIQRRRYVSDVLAELGCDTEGEFNLILDQIEVDLIEATLSTQNPPDEQEDFYDDHDDLKVVIEDGLELEVLGEQDFDEVLNEFIENEMVSIQASYIQDDEISNPDSQDISSEDFDDPSRDVVRALKEEDEREFDYDF